MDNNTIEMNRETVIKGSIRLQDELARLTKEELMGIARQYQINKRSGLKKQELIDTLVQQLPELVGAIFNHFNLKNYKSVKQIIQNKGQFSLKGFQYELFEYLVERGIVFIDKVEQTKVVMPEELMAVFTRMDKPAYVDRVQRNTEWIELTEGMLFYYGTLTLEKLEELMQQYTGMEEVEENELIELLVESEEYSNFVIDDRIGLSDFRVEDPEKVFTEHQMRSTLDYYPFTKQQLLQASDADFVDRNLKYLTFMKFLTKNFQIQREDADMLVEECLFAMQNGGSMMDIVESLKEHFEFNSIEEIQKMIALLVPLLNSTRQWYLKGWSPDELAPTSKQEVSAPTADRSNVVDFKTGKKVGRNDPCPCGSGKKFKKCCGENGI